MNNNLLKLKTDAEKTYSKGIDKLKDDFLNNLSWFGELTFRASYRIIMLDNLLSDIKKINELSFEEQKQHIIEYLTNVVLRSTKLMDRDSNPLSSYTSLWKNEETLRLIDNIKYFIK